MTIEERRGPVPIKGLNKMPGTPSLRIVQGWGFSGMNSHSHLRFPLFQETKTTTL